MLLRQTLRSDTCRREFFNTILMFGFVFCIKNEEYIGEVFFYLYEDLFDDLHSSFRLRPVYQ